MQELSSGGASWRSVACSAVIIAALGGCTDSNNGAPSDPGPSDTIVWKPEASAVETGGTDSTTPADTTTPVPDYGPPPDGMMCTPFEIRCAGPLSQKQCNPDGTAWTAADCPPGKGCVAGECVDQDCTPGESLMVCIDATSFERCNDSGTAIELHVCPGGQKCYLGSCIVSFCSPGKRVCKAPTLVQECNADGTAWVDAEICPKGGICDDGVCKSPCYVNIKDGSYLGCEYWALDLDNIEESEHAEVGVVVSVPTIYAGTNVQITNYNTGAVLTPAQLGVADTYVEAGEVEVFKLPPGFDIDGSVLTNKSFRIETTSPVAVHQFNPLNGEGVFSNDASLLLPSSVTGSQYIVMSWPHRGDGPMDLRGFVAVVATQPGGTTVDVTPTAAIAAGTDLPAIPIGHKQVFNLQQGQIINLETEAIHGADLTGTIINATQKISVIAGHECANVPLGITASDHLEQQLFPLETWSNEYVADAFKPRSPTQIDVWRVMAGANDVTVTTTPPVPGYETFVLQRGAWLQFATAASVHIEGDGPLMVGHYLTGANYPGAVDVQACEQTAVGKPEPIGDPAFTLAAPVKRYLKEYAVLTPSGYMNDYLNFVAKPGTTISIETCDMSGGQCTSQPLNASFVAIPGSGYSVATVPVVPGIHRLTGDQAFGLTAYGYDCDVSYAYPGGLKLQGVKEE